MTYALRNTLLLLLFFVIIAGGGGSYIYFVQKSTIEELEESLAEKQAEFEQLSAIAETYPVMLEGVERAENFIENYNKTLFPTNDPDQIYKFLAELNMVWPRVEFNYVFNDSTNMDQYGIVTSSLSGMGSYRAIYNFVNRIENSRPVQKVNDLQVSPINQIGEYGNANFTFQVHSYYDRTNQFETTEEDLLASLRDPEMFHNPFFPLIRDIEPNEDNLTDVENSRLVGVSSSRIFLRNQEGQLVNLTPNAEVYLGRLQAIDVQRGSAIFRLNKGGIIEEVTLEVRR